MDANPFAAPAQDAPRVPVDTTGGWWGMRSAFRVGGVPVEIETEHWTGTEVYRVDGREVARRRNLGWHAHQALEVDGHTVEVTSRWYPLLPVVVEVDGCRAIDDLFPQVRRLTRLIGTLAFLAMGVLALSILRDVAAWLATA